MNRLLKKQNIFTLLFSAILLVIILIPSVSVFAVEGGGAPIVNGYSTQNPGLSTPPPTSNPGTPENPVTPVVFEIPNPFGQQSFTLFDFVKRLVNLATKIAIPIIILMIIYAGFLFVKAQGAPEAITDAKRTLGYTLLGAGIILGANVIALAIETTISGLIK